MKAGTEVSAVPNRACGTAETANDAVLRVLFLGALSSSVTWQGVGGGRQPPSVPAPGAA